MVNRRQTSGAYRVHWDAGAHSSGIYFCRLEAGGPALTKKMLLKARKVLTQYEQQGAVKRGKKGYVDKTAIRERLKKAGIVGRKILPWTKEFKISHIDAFDPFFTVSKEAEGVLGRPLREEESPAAAATAMRSQHDSVVEWAIERGIPRFQTDETVGQGLKQIGGIILHVLDVCGVYPTEPGEREIEVLFPNPLPENMMEKLKEAQVKKELGVSQEQVLRELGYERIRGSDG